MTRNCPNCAAPIDPESNKCLYCGTSYFDMSAIDLMSNEPFYLKIKINGMILTQLVRPDPNITIELNSESYCAYGGRNNEKLISFRGQNSLTTDIVFRATPMAIKDKAETFAIVESIN